MPEDAALELRTGIGEQPESHDPEAAALSREMAAAKSKLVDWYCKHHKLSSTDALAKVEEFADAPSLHRALECDPAELRWFDIQQLAEADPDACDQRWKQIKIAADDELTSGHRAASVIGANATPLSLAQFF